MGKTRGSPAGHTAGNTNPISAGGLSIAVCVATTVCVWDVSAGAANCWGCGTATRPPQPARFVRLACACAEEAKPDWITLPSWDACRSKLTTSELLVTAWFTVCAIALELDVNA